MAAVSSGMPGEAMTKMMPRDVPRRGHWLGFAIVIYKKYSAQLVPCISHQIRDQLIAPTHPIGILGILKNKSIPGFRIQRALGSARSNILFDSSTRRRAGQKPEGL